MTLLSHVNLTSGLISKTVKIASIVYFREVAYSLASSFTKKIFNSRGGACLKQ